ncbi:TsgA protein -like protein [Salmonella enterica subsp. enterica serovar Pullorum]|nr:TsgA protein -like protein [Salmonella enterica subsp. enterica serovar Pullorum]
MTNSNRIKLTWISFLSYALTGALVIVTGMVMGNIADYFHLPVSSMSNTFTFLNAGILISIFLNAWLMEIVPLKTQLRFGFILMVLAVAGLMFSHSLALFSAAMFVLGAGQRDHHVDWHLPDYATVWKGVSAVPDCCLPTPSSAWRG